MIDEYMLCDILCMLDYAKWIVGILFIIYIIRRGLHGQDRNIKNGK